VRQEPPARPRVSDAPTCPWDHRAEALHETAHPRLITTVGRAPRFRNLRSGKLQNPRGTSPTGAWPATASWEVDPAADLSAVYRERRAQDASRSGRIVFQPIARRAFAIGSAHATWMAWREDRGVAERIGRIAAGVALLLLSLSGATAKPMDVVESKVLVDGQSVQYVVRFDSPVDHQLSRLFVTRGDRVVQTLRPRLRASPNVLAAFGPRLQPGDYELRWSARSVRDGGVTEGSIPFTVRQ
jgi:methionine-rich copper-binding protein CopC